ncbi:hypothetical protein B0H14DRAFT_2742241, partial [Mycena olivaceomarginata]
RASWLACLPNAISRVPTSTASFPNPFTSNSPTDSIHRKHRAQLISGNSTKRFTDFRKLVEFGTSPSAHSSLTNSVTRAGSTSMTQLQRVTTSTSSPSLRRISTENSHSRLTATRPITWVQLSTRIAPPAPSRSRRHLTSVTSWLSLVKRTRNQCRPRSHLVHGSVTSSARPRTRREKTCATSHTAPLSARSSGSQITPVRILPTR